MVPGIVAGIAAALMAFHAFPYAMARCAQTRDPRWLVGHVRAYRAALAYGRPYVRMWALTWTAIAISVAPAFAAILLVVVLGYTPWLWLVALPFPFMSPWAWSSLAYGFGTIIQPEIRERERSSFAGGQGA